MSGRVSLAPIRRHGPGTPAADHDLVAVEAPLAVVVVHPLAAAPRPFGVLMRTPGDDRDLVLGLLYAEGVIDRAADVGCWTWHEATDDPARVEAALADHVPLDEAAGARALSATSACGLCGRLEVTRLDALARAGASHEAARPLAASLVAAIPERLRSQQRVFAETGGLHAAALFDAAGDLIALREDVGRHNAVDKVVGAVLESGRLPGPGTTLGVSGRVAFEIVQKAARTGVHAIVAIGAPSSLAVDACRAAGITLVGFARDGRFNVYCGTVGQD